MEDRGNAHGFFLLNSNAMGQSAGRLHALTSVFTTYNSSPAVVMTTQCSNVNEFFFYEVINGQKVDNSVYY